MIYSGEERHTLGANCHFWGINEHFGGPSVHCGQIVQKNHMVPQPLPKLIYALVLASSKAQTYPSMC